MTGMRLPVRRGVVARPNRPFPASVVRTEFAAELPLVRSAQLPVARCTTAGNNGSRFAAEAASQEDKDPDEVGQIPLELQSKLLRVLQEKSYERIGDARTRTARG
jgi:hypothetical protein